MNPLREAQERLTAARAELDRLAPLAADSAALADEYHDQHYRVNGIEREISRLKNGLGLTAAPAS